MPTKLFTLSKNLIKPFFNQKWDISKIKEKESVYWRNNPGALFFIKKLQKNTDTTRKQKRILDLGCGDGRFTVQYARAGFSVIGIDFSKSAIVRLRNRAKKLETNNLIKGIVADLHNFSTGVNKFDGVACANTLHYFNDRELKNIVTKMKKITTENGLNYIAFECEIKMFLPDGRQFIFENQPHRNIKLIRKLLKKYYRGWKVLYQNTTTNHIKASLPPLLQNHLNTKSSYYRRSFEVFDFVVVRQF
ncbi:MAG: class I SAM-dependent methyltransferase [Patescibacteria group bacterium]